jgi:hypothetical protein
VAEIMGVGVRYLAGGIACVAMGIAGFFAPALMGIEDGTAEGPLRSRRRVVRARNGRTQRWREPS